MPLHILCRGIVDSTGNLVVSYTYDAWGNLLSCTGDLATIGVLNSLRYRGYVYDSETGFRCRSHRAVLQMNYRYS